MTALCIMQSCCRLWHASTQQRLGAVKCEDCYVSNRDITQDVVDDKGTVQFCFHDMAALNLKPGRLSSRAEHS